MRIFKFTGVIFAAAAVLLMAAGIGGYCFLQTQSGRNTLAHVVDSVTRDAGQHVQLRNISGNIFSDFTIDRVDISDKTGIWLSIKSLHIHWQPSALLRRQQGIQIIAAENIDTLRRPVLPPKKQDERKSRQWDIASLGRYIPKEIAVKEIRIDQAVAGHRQILSLTAQGSIKNYNLGLVTLDGPQTNLKMHAGFNSSLPSADFIFDEAADGIVVTLARLPEGTTLHAEAHITPNSGNILYLKKAFLTAGATRFEAGGAYDPKDKNFSGYANFDAPQLADFQAWSKQPLAGDARLATTFRGAPEKVIFTAALSGETIAIAKTQLSNTDFSIEGQAHLSAYGKDDFGARIKGEGRVFINNKNTQLTFASKVKGDIIALESARVDYDGYVVNGSGDFNRTSRAFNIDLTSDEFAISKAMPKTTLDGQAALRLSAQGDFDIAEAKGNFAVRTVQGNSTLDFTAEARNNLQDFTADLKGDLNHDHAHFDLLSGIAGNAENITVGSLDLRGPGVAVKGQGSWQKASKLADAALHIDIADFAPLGALLGIDLHGAARADALLAQENGVQRADVSLAKLQYVHDNLDIRLAKPTTFKMVDKNAVLSLAVLSIAGGTLTLQGSMSPKALNGTVDLRRLDINKLAKTGLESATLNGKITLSGMPAAPVIVTKTTLTAQSGNLPLSIAINGDWRQNKLHVQADTKARSATARIVSDLAASLSLKPFGTTLNKTTPLSGNVAANVPLAEFNTALWPRGHRINGNFGGNARLGGNLGTPQVLGRFVLDRFDYDNPASGVCLRNAHAVIDGSTKQITLHDFTARDPRGGAFNGNVQLTLAEPRPVNGALAFRNFRLFCGGLATGTLDGQVGAKGSLQAMAVTGKLTLGPLNVQIPAGRNTTNIPEVETVRIIPGAEISDKLKPQAVIRLDVALDAPSRIYVRGRGLDAEFGGNLHVGGTAATPDIRGSFASRRGRFTLLDRVMTLQRANLRFEGPIPPAPFLDVSADTDVQGTTITVNLTGPAAKPEFALTSSPSKPQDETLALLLFGRTLSTISPFQAYQLAQATRELAGLDGGGPGILDRARGVLGVDTLDVGTDDDNNVTVSTGKYITDKVYVGVQQGTTPESREVTTQIELTPNVNANTTLDADGNQGVGVGWKWDY